MVDGEIIAKLCESYKQEEWRAIDRAVLLVILWGLFIALVTWGDFQ